MTFLPPPSSSPIEPEVLEVLAPAATSLNSFTARASGPASRVPSAQRLRWLLPGLVGALLVLAAFLKISGGWSSWGALYGLVHWLGVSEPAAVTDLVLRFAVGCELLLGLLLLAGDRTRLAVRGTGLLLLAYTALLGLGALRLGPFGTCPCGLPGVELPLWGGVARNLAMLAALILGTRSWKSVTAPTTGSLAPEAMRMQHPVASP